jgi:hypothetical protein
LPEVVGMNAATSAGLALQLTDALIDPLEDGCGLEHRRSLQVVR